MAELGGLAVKTEEEDLRWWAGGEDRGGFEVVGQRWRQYRIWGWPAVETGGFG